MRQRLAIRLFLPCLLLAWPFVSFVRAQDPAAAPAPQPAAGAEQKAAAPAPGAEQKAAGEKPGAAAAEPAAPPVEEKPPADKYNDAHSIPRLHGPAISWSKLLLLFVLILLWVKSADWINRDTQIYNLGYGKWNPIIFFPFFAITLLFAFPILPLGYANFWL